MAAKDHQERKEPGLFWMLLAIGVACTLGAIYEEWIKGAAKF